MICTVSLNPAIDKYLAFGELRLGEHQQAREAVGSAGGKGINVAGVLRELGEDALVVGFFGGFTGDYILREVRREGIAADPVRVASLTRTAFVIVEENGRETEIVEPGGEVSAGEIAELRAKVREAAAKAEVMVLSGSVPPGCPVNIYSLLLADCNERCPVIVDTSRDWLRAVVEGTPAPQAVKPNRREAESLLGTALDGPADFARGLRRLAAGGIAMPVISDGAAGLYALDGDGQQVWRARPPQLRAVNSVGSGDAAVAGIACGLARGYGIERMLRLAAACGSANALTKECAQVWRADVERLEAETAVDCEAG